MEFDSIATRNMIVRDQLWHFNWGTVNLGGKPLNIGKRIVKIFRLNGPFGRSQLYSERKGGWG
jgi:hypothetical protein